MGKGREVLLMQRGLGTYSQMMGKCRYGDPYAMSLEVAEAGTIAKSQKDKAGQLGKSNGLMMFSHVRRTKQ